jgi:hypothetical protein
MYELTGKPESGMSIEIAEEPDKLVKDEEAVSVRNEGCPEADPKLYADPVNHAVEAEEEELEVGCIRLHVSCARAERSARDRDAPMPGRSPCVPISGTTSSASIPSSASSVSHSRILLFRLASPALSTRQRPFCNRPSMTASRQLYEKEA